MNTGIFILTPISKLNDLMDIYNRPSTALYHPHNYEDNKKDIPTLHAWSLGPFLLGHPLGRVVIFPGKYVYFPDGGKYWEIPGNMGNTGKYREI